MNKLKNILIFGTGNLSEVAYYYLKNDTPHKIAGFVTEKKYMNRTKKKFDLPIIEFDNMENTQFNPDNYTLFAPCSGTNLNRFRERIYNEGKDKGYDFYSYISSKANVFTKDIGENCFILEDNTIQPYTKIGNNCILWSGNHIGHHSTIEDHVFISSHAVISGMCNIKNYSWIGVNSTFRDQITVNEGTVVAMGACVTKDTEGNSIYMGSPAKKFKDCDETIIL
jgi:sugar O-acyltransferase (sialic acid O-acetyltransferase NeuD family)